MLLPKRTILGACLLVVLTGAVLALALDRTASALPPAGTDVLGATASISLTSRLGSENVVLKGAITVDRDAPQMDGGVEFVTADITEIDLSGQSMTGTVLVGLSAFAPSTGEIRSKQAGQEFPASSFFDVFVSATVPASPSPSIVLHNETAMRLTANPNLTAWPQTGATYTGTFSPCIPLLNAGAGTPTNPANVCVNSASITLSDSATPPPTPTTGAPQSTPTATSTSAPVATSTNTPAATSTVAPTSTNTPTRTATRTPTVPAKACGDVNDDGEVDSIDATLILQFSAELLDELENAESADANGDGGVDSVDALFILQVNAGLLDAEDLDCA